MFRLYRSTDVWAHAEPAIPVDSLDAQRMQKGVTALPLAHRSALCWYYLRPVDPRRAARQLGVPIDGLAQLVRDARQMLVNRRT